jgi:hypothetical protein
MVAFFQNVFFFNEISDDKGGKYVRYYKLYLTNIAMLLTVNQVLALSVVFNSIKAINVTVSP